MRKKVTHQGLTVQAIAGTHVVLLGFNMAEADCAGLMGFAIHRTDHIEEEAYWLKGQKTFIETDPGLPPGATYSTRKHPIQGFTWSDFSAKPRYDYTYRVLALKGTPHDCRLSRRCLCGCRWNRLRTARTTFASIAVPPPRRNTHADSATGRPVR
jgi:hypothetical protein